MPLFLRNITLKKKKERNIIFKCKGTSCLQFPLKWVKKIIKQQGKWHVYGDYLYLFCNFSVKFEFF